MEVEVLTNTEVYKIGNEAIIVLHSETGYVSVSCGWHKELNGCHWWNARSGQSLKKFLMDLQKDYAVSKLFGSHEINEFDLDKTVSRLKKMLLTMRREHDISDEEYKDDLKIIKDCCGGISDLASVKSINVYENCCFKEKDCIKWFWKSIWSAFIKKIKKETK